MEASGPIEIAVKFVRQVYPLAIQGQAYLGAYVCVDERGARGCSSVLLPKERAQFVYSTSVIHALAFENFSDIGD